MRCRANHTAFSKHQHSSPFANRFLSLLMLLFTTHCGREITLQSLGIDHVNMPFPSSLSKSDSSAEATILLQSNENCDFYIDGETKPSAQGKRVRVQVTNQPHHVMCRAMCYPPQEADINPPYDPSAPIGFTFLLTEKDKRCRYNEMFRSSTTAPPAEPSAKMSKRSGSTKSNLSGNSYALVIGINTYRSPKWLDLGYAAYDARGMEELLSKQDFKVIALYGSDATKQNILRAMEDELAEVLQENDRVLVFFAGHGETKTYNGKDFGYIVPHDGNENASSYISMEQLRELSRKMSKAKHQLFIMDSCYGGQLAEQDRESTIKIPKNPDYIKKLTSRTARQILTAGGKEETVQDFGPGRYSCFTDYLIKAIEGEADQDHDGYILFSELAVYMYSRASTCHSVPVAARFPDEGGEFTFFKYLNQSE